MPSLFQAFRFYDQKESEMREDPNAASTPWAQMTRLAFAQCFNLIRYCDPSALSFGVEIFV
jgi:hypothetical protein